MATETAVKEHPMLFVDELARALDAGKKTQTRRPVTARNSTVLGYPGCQFWDQLLWDRAAWKDPSARSETGGLFDGPRQQYDYMHVAAWNPADGAVPAANDDLCYYRVRPTIYPGERIWVRETWHPGDGDLRTTQFRADSPLVGIDPWDVFHGSPNRWFPSIHMPRNRCRTVLEVTDVAVERVNEITCRGVVAEGFPFSSDLDQFKAVWKSLYKGALSWESNPWVWVYTFHKV